LTVLAASILITYCYLFLLPFYSYYHSIPTTILFLLPFYSYYHSIPTAILFLLPFYFYCHSHSTHLYFVAISVYSFPSMR
jgi:hypothetical protein